MGTVIAAASIVGIVFALWFAAASFLFPILMRTFPMNLSLAFVVGGLLLSAIYTFIHYRLLDVVYWPIMIVAAVLGFFAAYILQTLVGIFWALELWVIGAVPFVAPPIAISLLTTLRRRKVAETVEQVEVVPVQETIVPQVPANTSASPEPSAAPQPSPSQEPASALTYLTVEPVSGGATPSQYTYSEQEITYTSKQIDSEDLEDFILDFVDQKKITEITPLQSATADGGFYPVLQDEIDVDTTRLTMILKRLAEKGIIKIGGIGFKRIACPQCFSCDVMFNISCKSCKSPNISRQRILQHESCGFLGPEERFLEGTRYMCPRCGSEVTIAHEGMESGVSHDVAKVHSSLFMCYQCNEVNNEPYVTFKCVTCGTQFDYNALELKTFYKYVVNVDKLSKTLESNKPIKLIADKIRSFGFAVERNAKIVGASNLPHRVDLMFRRNDQTKVLLIFLKTDRKEEQVNNIMKIMTIKLDVLDADLFLLSYFPLHEEAKRLVEMFNIYYLDSILSRDPEQVALTLFSNSRKISGETRSG
ncbi:MAG: hypothetical protein QXN23_05460 [Candidatus Caldarchaeum sp.]|jgi:ribosomal protein S27AE|nr:hypothetical protein [Candidatus Caldarchaeales archaeon]